jgi:hypothetical protein
VKLRPKGNSNMKKQSKTIEITSPPGSEALPAVVKLNLLTRCEGLGMQANLIPCLENLRFCCDRSIRRLHQRTAMGRRET